MVENYTVCNCKKVNYADISNAVHNAKKFDDVLEAFDEVQMITSCSTGCGGCYHRVLDVISEILSGSEE